MLRGSNARRRHADLARIGFGIGNKLRDGLRRKRLIDLHDVGKLNETGNRLYVSDEIEIEPFIQRRIDRTGRTDQAESIAISGRTHDCLSGEIAAGTRPIFYNKWLT